MNCRQIFSRCKNNTGFNSLVTLFDSSLGLLFKIQRNFKIQKIRRTINSKKRLSSTFTHWEGSWTERYLGRYTNNLPQIPLASISTSVMVRSTGKCKVWRDSLTQQLEYLKSNPGYEDKIGRNYLNTFTSSNLNKWVLEFRSTKCIFLINNN